MRHGFPALGVADHPARSHRHVQSISSLPIFFCRILLAKFSLQSYGEGMQMLTLPPAEPATLAWPALLRRARLVALAVGGLLLPWCVLLSAILPATARVQNWSLAWAGL